MYYKRDAERELIKFAKAYPVVTIIGPRQSGKTTLATKTFSNKPYINLEDPDILAKIEYDPKGMLSQYDKTGVVIDEVQLMPKLLSYIQVICDKLKKNGHFIITGSNQLALSSSVSQSLAGRTAIIELLPLSINELHKNKKHNIGKTDKLIINGFFPKIYSSSQKSYDLYKFYMKTYIERDVRQLINLKNLKIFQNFLKLCAGRIGQVLNIHSLSNELGITSNTVKEWLSVLESSYIIYTLPPYFQNFGKRVIKSSKLYFTDTGLASSLLGIVDEAHISAHPLRGHLFENLVVMEIYKYIKHNNLSSELYYYLDNNKNEVDIVLAKGSKLIPIEIKSSQTFNESFLKGIHYFQSISKPESKPGYLIYSGNEQENLAGTQLLNYTNCSMIFK